MNLPTLTPTTEKETVCLHYGRWHAMVLWCLADARKYPERRDFNLMMARQFAAMARRDLENYQRISRIARQDADRRSAA